MTSDLWVMEKVCLESGFFLVFPHVLQFVSFHHVISKPQTSVSVSWISSERLCNHLHWKSLLFREVVHKAVVCFLNIVFLATHLSPLPPTSSGFVVSGVIKCNPSTCWESGGEANPELHMAFCLLFPGFFLLIVIFESKLHFWSLYYSDCSELHSTLVWDGPFTFVAVKHAFSCISAESGIP